MADPFLVVDLPDEAATQSLAEDVAACLRKGDVIALSGDLGTGKTTFARALVRARAGDLTIEVPSPTFTLVQTYDVAQFPVVHVDLYRVGDAAEIEEAGILDALRDGAVVIEWPERAESRLPGDRLDVALEMAGTGRRAALTGPEDWHKRIDHSRAARAFLDRGGLERAHRLVMLRDAEPRRLERIAIGDRSAALIDWQRDMGEDSHVNEFVAVNAALGKIGLSVPDVLATDAARGFALTEDFGEGSLADADGKPLPDRYFAAIEALAEIHVQPRPPVLETATGNRSIDNLGVEQLVGSAALFSHVYPIHLAGKPLAERLKSEFERLWVSVLEPLVEVERGWVLYPNLYWLADRSGLNRVGILALSKLFVGPTAHDVALICQDQQATIEPELEAELKNHYVALRKAAHPRFDGAGFEMAYAILATVRASAALGHTAALAVLDPAKAEVCFSRLLTYLRRDLAHPVLSPLAAWYERHLPPRW